MKGTNKLLLDLVIGAVVPILILNNFARLTGYSDTSAYILAALIPVAYVLLDTFVISRRFNAITTYIALANIVSGALVFWFVDGVLYALKDTAALIVAVLVFLGSLVLKKPFMQFFAAQSFQPDSPTKDAALKKLWALPEINRKLILGTLVMVGYNAVAAAINFVLNLRTVTAPFGEKLFNEQVAQVNAITRIIFTIGGLGSVVLAFALVASSIAKALHQTEVGKLFEGDFWELVRKAGYLER